MTQDELLQTTHDAVIEVVTLIKGTDGHLGIIGELIEIKATAKEAYQRVTILEEKHDKLNKTVWTVIGILAGSGVITGSALGIIKLVT